MTKFAVDFNAQKLLDVLADVFSDQHRAEYGFEITYIIERKKPPESPEKEVSA